MLRLHYNSTSKPLCQPLRASLDCHGDLNVVTCTSRQLSLYEQMHQAEVASAMTTQMHQQTASYDCTVPAPASRCVSRCVPHLNSAA
jgi:hypothetical protein